MVSRVVFKAGIDNITGGLFGLGSAGVTIAIYEGKIIPGVFGVILLSFAIGLRIFRTIWNEGGKQNGKN